MKLIFRQIWITVVSSLLFLSIILKSLYLVLMTGFPTRKPPDIFRFSIYDNNKALLAFSKQIESIYMNSRAVPDCMKEYIKKEFKLKSFPNSSFAWLKRDADKETLVKVKSMNIPGLYIKKDWKRVYPSAPILSNLIGFCDQNLDGKYGIEYALNKELFKKDIALTIDTRIQKIMAEILGEAISQFDVEGASALVVDAQSGEILAMISLPCPEKTTDFLEYKFRNRNLDPIEVGSILKLHNVAMALETGLYNLDSVVDGRGPLKIAGFEINDFFGVNNYMTLRESIWRSSNIASARVALQIGAEKQKKFFEKLGFLEDIEWIKGHRIYPKKPYPWRKTTTATLSYGYGIGLSSLHIARSILRILHGYDIDLKIIKGKEQQKKLDRIISEKTSCLMREVMQEVIKSSKSKELKSIGYEVGGKTGTANICIKGRYLEGRNFVTMACIFPASLPKILILMQMKDPKKTGLTSGRKFVVAGSVLSDYMAKAIRRIGPLKLIRSLK